MQRLSLSRENGERCSIPRKSLTAIQREKPTIVAMVHGETSTGCIQPFDGIGAACREVDALLVVDAVATIGGVPVKTDEWQLDAVIGGTQKCLSVPSGMSPITYNDRVEAKVMRRKTIERGLREKGSAVSAGKAGREQLFRPRPAAGLLESEAAQSSYGGNVDAVRFARRFAHCAAGGPRGAIPSSSAS